MNKFEYVVLKILNSVLKDVKHHQKLFEGVIIDKYINNISDIFNFIIAVISIIV